jgi:hypothetical protein
LQPKWPKPNWGAPWEQGASQVGNWGAPWEQGASQGWKESLETTLLHLIHAREKPRGNDAKLMGLHNNNLKKWPTMQAAFFG